MFSMLFLLLSYLHRSHRIAARCQLWRFSNLNPIMLMMLCCRQHNSTNVIRLYQAGLARLNNVKFEPLLNDAGWHGNEKRRKKKKTIIRSKEDGMEQEPLNLVLVVYGQGNDSGWMKWMPYQNNTEYHACVVESLMHVHAWHTYCRNADWMLSITKSN